MAATATKPAPPAPRAQPRTHSARPIRLVVLALVLVIGGTLIQGNLILVAMSWLARSTTDLEGAVKVEGVRKVYALDDTVLRGAQPGMPGYRSLAARGVTTVVDLRPGSSARADDPLRALGMEVIHLPITDGQPPSPEQVRQFVDIARASDGLVFVHCGEGVGRAGTMSAAYRVTTGRTDSSHAVRESLAVGVLTLEQVAFVNALDRDGAHEPPAVIAGLSRYLDGPRQLFNKIR